MSLRILIIGGIYSFPERRSLLLTPETTLEAGLRLHGHTVDTHCHDWHYPTGRWDVVHVHHLGAQTMLQTVHPSGRRFVFTRHGTQPVSGARALTLRLALRRADSVVALSAAEASALRDSITPERVALIPNGIDDSHWPFSDRSAPSHNEPWIVLFVGQLLEVKQVDQLFAAVARLAHDERVVIRLVYHHSGLEASLRKLAVDLGIAKLVSFVGALSAEQLRSEYAQAHVLVLPSKSEALPSVITEAMLSGLPVLASAVGGIPEQLAGHGTTFPPGDSVALALALRRTFASYRRATQEAVLAAAYARSHYSVEQMVRSHISLYTRLVAQ
jgi:glycosyltransferase involved in cell wall biosynthesis